MELNLKEDRQFTCHSDDSQPTMKGIYLSHLRFSSIAIKLKADREASRGYIINDKISMFIKSNAICLNLCIPIKADVEHGV